MEAERKSLLQEVNLARERALYYAALCRDAEQCGARLKAEGDQAKAEGDQARAERDQARAERDQLEAEFDFVRRSRFYRGWLKYQALYALPVTGSALRRARDLAKRVLRATRARSAAS